MVLGGVGNGGLQEEEVRTPGLRIERLSAASFIICTSFEIVRCATPRSAKRRPAGAVTDDNSVLGPVTSSL